MIIAVDFDGTVVDHRFPAVGPDVPGAASWLRQFVDHGARLMLWTMRSGGRPDGTDPLADAVEWFSDRGIPLWGVNANPEQASWTGSPKQYAHLYIDDAAFGCPLRDHPSAMSSRKCVDWAVVGPAVVAMLTAKKEPTQ